MKDLPLTRDNIYSELIAELKKPLLVASSMSNDTFLKDWAINGEQDGKKIQNYLQEIKREYDFFSTFFISNSSNVYYHFTGKHKKISRIDLHDKWYYDFIGSGKDYELDIDNNEIANNELTIFINFRLEDYTGNLLGVCGVGLKFDTFAELIDFYQKKYDRSIYLADRNGLIHIHSDTSLVEKEHIQDMPGLKTISKSVLKQKNNPGTYQFTRDGHNILLTTRLIPELNWFLFVEQDETKALATARQNFYITLGTGMLVSILIITATVLTINRYQNTVEAMSVTDELTQAANRRALDAAFIRARAQFERLGRAYSLVLLDLDGFKRINDEQGHLVGDQTLIQIVEHIKTQIRPVDLLARWGGDEFILLCEETAPNASVIAERIRQSVAQDDLGVTVSCGVAQIRPGDSLDDLMLRADRAMYRGKAQGGNAVQVAVSHKE